MAKPLKRPTAVKKKAAPAIKRPVGRPSGVPHETVFEMYRELGQGRTFRKLAEAVKMRWPANAVAYTTLAGWAKQHDWAKRISEYERGLRQSAPAPIAAFQGDDVEALEKAASQALARVLSSSQVAVTKPGDVKALVDTANKALELADRLRAKREGTATSEEIAEFGRTLMVRIDQARKKDFVACAKAAAEAACEEAGLTKLSVKVLRAAAGALGLRVGEDGKIEETAETIDEESSEVNEITNEAIDEAIDEASSEVNNSNGAVDKAEMNVDEIMRKLRGE